MLNVFYFIAKKCCKKKAKTYAVRFHLIKANSLNNNLKAEAGGGREKGKSKLNAMLCFLKMKILKSLWNAVYCALLRNPSREGTGLPEMPADRDHPHYGKHRD